MAKQLKILFVFLWILNLSALSAAAPAPDSTPAPTQQVAPTPAEPSHPIPPMDTLTEETPSAPTYEGAFFKMIFSLIGLLLLIFLTFWLFRRFSQGRIQGMSLSRSIKVLERRPLSAKTMLYLIEIDQKKIIVSESQLEIRTLYSEDKDFPKE